MKRITIYIAHLLVLVLTGCDKTVLEFPENEGVDPTLVNANLSLAIDPKIEPYEQTGRSEGEVLTRMTFAGSSRYSATRSAANSRNGVCSAASRRRTDTTRSTPRWRYTLPATTS